MSPVGRKSALYSSSARTGAVPTACSSAAAFDIDRNVNGFVVAGQNEAADE